jgi:hypothetical protein
MPHGRGTRRKDKAGSALGGVVISLVELAALLELAWSRAPPGREAAMHNELMRELWRKLRQSVNRNEPTVILLPDDTPYVVEAAAREDGR